MNGISVKWPEGISRAVGEFYCGESELQIYVEGPINEDNSTVGNLNINIWNNIIGGILPKDIHFKSVIPLGNRENVLNECKLNQDYDGRKKLFIIDGDFDIIRGYQNYELKYLYRLKAYCIENYLLQDSSIIDACKTINPHLNNKQIIEQLSIDEWKTKNENCYRKLFICYAIMNKYIPSIQTVCYNVHKLNDKEHLNEAKIDKRIFELYEKLKEVISDDCINYCREKLHETTSKISFMQYVSGKVYLFKLIRIRMYDRIRGGRNRLDDDQLLHLLSEKYDSEFDLDLKEKIISMVENLESEAELPTSTIRNGGIWSTIKKIISGR